MMMMMMMLRELHWLRVPSGSPSGYAFWHTVAFMEQRRLTLLRAFFLRTSSDVDTRRRLRSADSATLVVPSTRRTMLGDRAFPVASARAWNSLPSYVRNAPSLMSFRRDLEDCTFSVVVRSSLGDRNCTIYCNYCLPAATGYQRFCLFLFY